MRACYQKSIPEMVKNAEELAAQNRERQKSFLEYSLSMIRESLALHYREESIVYLPDEELDFAVKFAPYVTGDNVMQMQEELTKAFLDIERNANGRIVFLDLALRIASLMKQT
jgi:DNA polymerase-3 subunit delta'